jgi:hypothetical protein
MPARRPEELEVSEVEARRAFLKNCAKYAAAMPPAITLLLAAGDARADPTSDSPACTKPDPSNEEKPPNCPNGAEGAVTESGELVDPELSAQ